MIDSSSATSIPAPKKRRGRRPTPRTVKIRRMLAEGTAPREIAARLKIDPQIVHNVRWLDKKRDASSTVVIQTHSGRTLEDLLATQIAQAQTQDVQARLSYDTPVHTPTAVVFVADTSAPAAPSAWSRVKGWFGWR